MYHQRAGIAKEKPYTEWKLPTDHHPQLTQTKMYLTSIRFMDLDKENGDLQMGYDSIIDTLNTSWGWYHDAGDRDGYPSHINVPKYLLLTYEAAPEKFADGELNIPGSGDGIPDILNEAYWLVNYFRRNVGPTGGVFGERISPDLDKEGKREGYPSWENQQEWIAYAEEPLTSFDFAGIALHVAFCLKLAQEQTGENFSDSISALITEAKSVYAWAKNNPISGLLRIAIFESGETGGPRCGTARPRLRRSMHRLLPTR